MLLYRYIVKEHIFPFLASLSIIVFLFIMQQAILMLDRIVSKNIDPFVVLEVFLVQLGWILALGIPMAILSATLMTFGRMAGDNEITAIKASGRSMSTLVVPVMAAAAVVTVALCYFHDLILPEANHHSAGLLGDISRKRPAAFIEPGVLIRDFQDYALYVEDVNTISGDLTGIRVFSEAPGADPTVTVAERGNIRMTNDGEYLVLSLEDGETHSTSSNNDRDYFTVRFKEQVVYIKNIDTRFERTGAGTRGDREKSIAMLMDDVRELRKTNDMLKSEMIVAADSISAIAARIDAPPPASTPSLSTPPPSSASTSPTSVSTSKSTSSSPPAPNRPPPPPPPSASAAQGQQGSNIRQDRENRHSRQNRQDANRLRYYENGLERHEKSVAANEAAIAQNMVEVHKKFAIPAACLLFVLIGAPLGIMARRGGLAVGASYSVFFFVIYWVFLITGENWGDRLIVSPAAGMWSGNVFLLLCGIALMILMLRETSISFGFAKNIFGKSAPVFKRIAGMWIFKLPGILFKLPRMALNLVSGRLPTYLMGIFLGYALGLLIALAVIFVTIDYVGNLKRFERASYAQIALYYYYYLPWIIQTVLPIVLFLSSMFSMGRIARTSELTAMKAAGVNVRQLIRPLLVFGLALSAGVFFGGEKVIPHANEQRIILRSNFGKPESEAEPAAGQKTIREYRKNFFYFASPDIMYVFNEFCTEPQFFRGVRRYTFTKGGIAERIDAAEADYDDAGWRFVNGRARRFDGSGMTFEKFGELPDDALTSAPLDLVKRVRSKESMSYWELANHMEAARRRGEKVDKFEAELQFKIALPFMNFIVILFGLSLAARAGRRGGAALFGAGLLLSFIFWIFSRFTLVFAQNGYLPTLVGAWIGNVIFFIIGLALYRKAAH